MSTAGEPASPARLEAIVRGRVQGVGYRYFVLERANALGLTGWVANEADRSVRCVAEGPRSALETLAADLAHGPLGAFVDTVDATWVIPSGAFTRFEVRSGSHSGD